MTKFILVASTDQDLLNIANVVVANSTNYWNNAEIIVLDGSYTGKYEAEAKLELAQHHTSGIENIIVLSYGNAQEIGNNNLLQVYL